MLSSENKKREFSSANSSVFLSTSVNDSCWFHFLQSNPKHLRFCIHGKDNDDSYNNRTRYSLLRFFFRAPVFLFGSLHAILNARSKYSPTNSLFQKSSWWTLGPIIIIDFFYPIFKHANTRINENFVSVLSFCVCDLMGRNFHEKCFNSMLLFFPTSFGGNNEK